MTAMPVRWTVGRMCDGVEMLAQDPRAGVGVPFLECAEPFAMMLKRLMLIAFALRAVDGREAMIIMDRVEGGAQDGISAGTDDRAVESHVKLEKRRQIIDGVRHFRDQIAQLARLGGRDAARRLAE